LIVPIHLRHWEVKELKLFAGAMPWSARLRLYNCPSGFYIFLTMVNDRARGVFAAAAFREIHG
jgi:hypothetical protein